MTYKEVVKQAAQDYARKYPQALFLGYNVSFGSGMYGTLGEVKPSQKLEMPVAENLMMGMSVGMALVGFRPVVCFERHDFLLLALDALVNHADKMPELSGGQFKLPILVRAIVGASEPLNPGLQHTQDYTDQLATMLKYTDLVVVKDELSAHLAYDRVGKSGSGVVVAVEYRDRYKDIM